MGKKWALKACPHCHTFDRNDINCRGSYVRKGDSRFVYRYYCKKCGKHYSEQTGSDDYRDHETKNNMTVYHLLVSGVSLRRIAMLTGHARKTVTRRFLRFGKLARRDQEILLKKLETDDFHFLFDDMETYEHSRLKPISITVAVHSSRFILATALSTMPPKKNTEKAILKYGKRDDTRSQSLSSVLDTVKQYIKSKSNHEEIKVFAVSDMAPWYEKGVKLVFEDINYKQFKSRKAIIAGQGELKEKGNDPLFSLNHTCAMLRANISRLFRRSWNTTKCIERLQCHLDIYTLFHNAVLLHNTSNKW